MKKFRYKFYGFCGVKFMFYTIAKYTEKDLFVYYVNEPFTPNLGDILLFKSKNKISYLNKYTLTLLGILYTIIFYLIIIPIAFVLVPIAMYFEGMRNFIKNKSWVQNVRYFNWCNILIILVLLIILIFR